MQSFIPLLLTVTAYYQAGTLSQWKKLQGVGCSAGERVTLTRTVSELGCTSKTFMWPNRKACTEGYGNFFHINDYGAQVCLQKTYKAYKFNFICVK